MVHKATGGVPRLINQVCDHVLLLAYAAGVHRIEPAHVEEAWADLQQLPTPWNEPATVARGSNVVEFGGLDDAGDVPPIAGRISAAVDDARGTKDSQERPDYVFADTTTATGLADPLPTHYDPLRGAPVPRAPRLPRWACRLPKAPADDGTSEQLDYIRKLVADVQAEFQPMTADGPEVELVFEAPHPFVEPFEEEEVIADRYASTVGAAVVAQAAPSLSSAPGQLGGGTPTAISATSTALPPETIPLPQDRDRTPDEAAAEIANEDAAPDLVDRPARPARTNVPPPKKQFGRLFAGLRRGS